VLATLDIPELTAQVEGADAGVRQTQEEITARRAKCSGPRPTMTLSTRQRRDSSRRPMRDQD